MASEVILPKLGMNMETATILHWYKQEGDVVAVGDVLADVETDKTTMQLEAETAGVLRRLLAVEGAEVEVNAPIAIIGGAQEDISALLESPRSNDAHAHVERVYDAWKGGAALPSTEPNGHTPVTVGQRVARRFDVDRIRGRLADKGVLPPLAGVAPASVVRIVIYGAGLGAKQLLEVTRHLDDVRVVGLIDDKVDMHGAQLAGVPVLGGFEHLCELVRQREVDGVALSFHSEVRRKVHRRIQRDLPELRFVPLVDPRAHVGMDVEVGAGALIEAGAVVGPGTIVGEGVIVDVGATIAHDCHLGPFSHLSPGCTLSGVVNLTENVLVGAGAAINSTVTVGANCIIAPGSAVMNDLPPDVVASGVPARVIGESRRGA